MSTLLTTSPAVESYGSFLVLDRSYGESMRQERERLGIDRWDEVWEGQYIMASLPNNEHQHIATRIVSAMQMAVGWETELQMFAGCNVSDRGADWTNNFRCPDVAVFLPGSVAQDFGTHWRGGPDFAIEIISPNDRSREKLDFYASIGVRELLIIDRYPWKFELYRLLGKTLKHVGDFNLGDPGALASSVIPFSFALVSGDGGPKVQLQHPATGQQWKI